MEPYHRVTFALLNRSCAKLVQAWGGDHGASSTVYSQRRRLLVTLRFERMYFDRWAHEHAERLGLPSSLQDGMSGRGRNWSHSHPSLDRLTVDVDFHCACLGREGYIEFMPVAMIHSPFAYGKNLTLMKTMRQYLNLFPSVRGRCLSCRRQLT